jgi:hypothetical protein
MHPTAPTIMVASGRATPDVLREANLSPTASTVEPRRSRATTLRRQGSVTEQMVDDDAASRRGRDVMTCEMPSGEVVTYQPSTLPPGHARVWQRRCHVPHCSELREEPGKERLIVGRPHVVCMSGGCSTIDSGSLLSRPSGSGGAAQLSPWRQAEDTAW